MNIADRGTPNSEAFCSSSSKTQSVNCSMEIGWNRSDMSSLLVGFQMLTNGRVGGQPARQLWREPRWHRPGWVGRPPPPPPPPPPGGGRGGGGKNREGGGSNRVVRPGDLIGAGFRHQIPA